MAMSQITVCLRNWNWELCWWWWWWWWWLSKLKRHTERAHRATNKYYVQEEESKQPRGTTIAINQGKFYPEGTPGNFWRHFNYHNWEILGGGVLLASRGWRPGMILDILVSRTAPQQRLKNPEVGQKMQTINGSHTLVHEKRLMLKGRLLYSRCAHPCASILIHRVEVEPRNLGF